MSARGKTMTRSVATLAALALLTAAAAAQTPDEPAAPLAGLPSTKPLRAARPDPPVAQLIGQLADPDFRTREAAGRALQARADEALPQLRRAHETAGPEARRRLDDILRSLEQRVLLAPKRVTVRAINRPVSEIVGEISRQTGYRLQGDQPGTRLTLDMVDVPFWEAIDRLSLAAGLIPSANDNDGTVTLTHQDAYVPFVWHTGPFRLAASGFHVNRTLNFNAWPRDPTRNIGQHSENFQFAFAVAVEPKMPLVGTGQARATEAVDDRGRSLLINDSNNAVHQAYYYSGGRSLMQYTGVQLAVPDKDARKVRLLRGNVPVTVLLEQRPAIVIDKILTAGKRKLTAGPVELELIKVTETGRNYGVELSVRKATQSPVDDSNWVNSLYQRIELQDAKGRRYLPQGFTENSSPSGVNGTFQFAHDGRDLGPPERLVYYHWVTAQHAVPFEFRDLPLP
jgi:hypothetical protein